MTVVTDDQFEIESDLKVTHRPTGAYFSTYRYDSPDDVVIVHRNNGRTDAALEDGSEFTLAEVQSVALKLLRDQARKRISSS